MRWSKSLFKVFKSKEIKRYRNTDHTQRYRRNHNKCYLRKKYINDALILIKGSIMR